MITTPISMSPVQHGGKSNSKKQVSRTEGSSKLSAECSQQRRKTDLLREAQACLG